jgi:GntR family transcriptional regulator, rspAB operon transcriptional repressor
METIAGEPMPEFSSSSDGTPRPLRREAGVSAVQQVYDGLRHRIIDLLLQPGSTIAKKETATEFGVSQTPVRDALLRLADEGLVDIFPQSRTIVSFIDVQQAREVLFLRRSVEIEVLRVLTKTIDERGMAELHAWIERQVAELNAGDQGGFNVADISFHNAMFRLANVEGLTRVINSRRGHYDRIRGLYLMDQEPRELVVQDHRAIVAALEARDATAAEAALRYHTGKSIAIIDKIRARHPRFFL